MELVRNDVIYPTGYLYLPEKSKTKEELKRLTDMKLLIQSNIDNNSTLRHLTNSESYKERLHESSNVYRGKLYDVNKELQDVV